MALQTQIWVNKVQDELYRNAAFITQSTDHKKYIMNQTVHIPQSGAGGTVTKNPSTFPLGITKRVDTDRTYQIDQYAFNEAQLVSNIDELQFSYDVKNSVVGQQISQMTEYIGDNVAINWTAEGASNIIPTTGSAVNGSLPSGATGTRKAVTLADILSLSNKMNNDNVSKKGRILLMTDDMFGELLLISEVLRASYNGFMNKPNVLETGVVGQLFGFNIITRPTVSVFANGSTTVKAYGAATATGDRAACIAFHPTVVSRALSSINPMYNAGSGGTGDPLLLGSTFNIEVMLGAAILRTDMKGVASLVQAWVS